MKLRYLGHAAFELLSDGGSSIVFDPYESGSYDGALAYGPISGRYDIAVVSHDHADHRDPDVTARAKHVVDGPGAFEFGGVRVTARPTFHDESRGKERGKNLVSVVELDGMRVAHLGDLGHALGEEDMKALGRVDVLFVPVGGHFTIDAEAAAALIRDLAPGIAIPPRSWFRRWTASTGSSASCWIWHDRRKLKFVPWRPSLWCGTLCAW